MSSKYSLFLLKGIVLLQLLLSISAIYHAYTNLARTYNQISSAIWITFGVFLYWIIVGPIFVWGLKDSERRQRTLKFIGGITLFLMLGLLIMLFSRIASELQLGELIRYASTLMLCGLISTFFIAMQLSGGWDKLSSKDTNRSRRRRLG